MSTTKPQQAKPRRLETAANPRLVAALGYAKRGWAVLPLRPRDKTPATRHGFKDATIEKAAIVRAWSAKPDANVGIATGVVSRIVVLDVDPRNGGDVSLAELERIHGPLPDTLRVATGGRGIHVYFLADGPVPSGDLAPGLEVKGDGRYVVAPPSVHPNGPLYRWENDPFTTTLVAPPAWLTVSKKKRAKPTPESAATDAAASPVGACSRALECSALERSMAGSVPSSVLGKPSTPRGRFMTRRPSFSRPTALAASVAFIVRTRTVQGAPELR